MIPPNPISSARGAAPRKKNFHPNVFAKCLTPASPFGNVFGSMPNDDAHTVAVRETSNGVVITPVTHPAIPPSAAVSRALKDALGSSFFRTASVAFFIVSNALICTQSNGSSRSKKLPNPTNRSLFLALNRTAVINDTLPTCIRLEMTSIGANTTDAANAPAAAAALGDCPKCVFAVSYVAMNSAVPGTVPMRSGTNPRYNIRRSSRVIRAPSARACARVLSVLSGKSNN